MLEPRPISRGGKKLSGSGSTIYRRLEAAAGAAALVSRQRSPPLPVAAENNNKNDNSKDIQQSHILLRNVSLFKTDELRYLDATGRSYRWIDV